jgi:hypothetical protein
MYNATRKDGAKQRFVLNTGKVIIRWNEELYGHIYPWPFLYDSRTTRVADSQAGRF